MGSKRGFDARVAHAISFMSGWTLLGSHRFAHQIIVIRLNHHDFRTESRDFKSVIITYQHQVFTLETSNSSASRGVEETHFIANIHNLFPNGLQQRYKKAVRPRPLDLRN